MKTWLGTRTPGLARSGAFLVGVAYAAIGVIGFFVTGFTNLTGNEGEALLIFDLNPFHNIVHLGIGAGLIAVSLSGDSAIAEGALIAGGLVYVLAAVLGFLNALPILAIDSPFAPDNVLHLLSGVAALGLGIAGARQVRHYPQGAGPAS